MTALAALTCLYAAPAAAQAAAQDRPPVLPTRDVDVTYRSEQGGQVLEQRSRFSTQAQRMRVDAPTPGVYTIMDYRNHVLAFVSDADRASLETATPPTPPQAPAYQRRGAAQIAGLACTEWEVRDSTGHAALTCFTPDGVMLRARRGDQVLAIATRVAFAPMDPALFSVPATYQRLQKRPPQ